eukprot:1156745-Pelagomonas_calceolata.AAC.16
MFSSYPHKPAPLKTTISLRYNICPAKPVKHIIFAAWHDFTEAFRCTVAAHLQEVPPIRPQQRLIRQDHSSARGAREPGNKG